MYFVLDGDGYVVASCEVEIPDAVWIEPPAEFDWQWQGAYRYQQEAWTLDTDRLEQLQAAEMVITQKQLQAEEGQALREQLMLSRIAVDMDDGDVARYALAWPAWTAGERYVQGQVVTHHGVLYRVQQDVDALEHQPPDAVGMLAIYRPVVIGNAGTLDDPIPFIYGMHVSNGLYYSYEDVVYLAMTDMPACVWAPGTAGLWQWEAVA